MRIRPIVRAAAWPEDMFSELAVPSSPSGSGRKDVVTVVLSRLVRMCVGAGLLVWRVVCVEVTGLLSGSACTV